jgi:hypothetical protein
MPYDPNPVTPRERSDAFFQVWVGLALSFALVGTTAFSSSLQLRGAAGWLVGLQLLIFAVSPRFDSYFRALRGFGTVVAVAILALWLAVNGLLQNFDGSAEFVNDPWLLAGLAAVGFHAGFLFAHLRGTSA